MVKIKSLFSSDYPHIRSILNVLGENTRDINYSDIGFFGFKSDVTKTLLKGQLKNACHQSCYLSKMVKIKSRLCSNDPHIRHIFIVFGENASYNNYSNLSSIEFRPNVTKMLLSGWPKNACHWSRYLSKMVKIEAASPVMVHTLEAFWLSLVRMPVTITRANVTKMLWPGWPKMLEGIMPS